LIYAAPNLYPPDPAIQIMPSRAGTEIPDDVLVRVRQTLEQRGIEYFGEELRGSTVLMRLRDSEQQLPAKDALQRVLGDNFVVALNLAPTTPDWLLSMGAGPMTMGLDLSGGVHFLMEVDMDDYLKSKVTNYREELRNRLREEQLRYRRIQIDGSVIRITFADTETRTTARGFFSRNYPEFAQEEAD